MMTSICIWEYVVNCFKLARNKPEYSIQFQYVIVTFSSSSIKIISYKRKIFKQRMVWLFDRFFNQHIQFYRVITNKILDSIWFDWICFLSWSLTIFLSNDFDFDFTKSRVYYYNFLHAIIYYLIMSFVNDTNKFWRRILITFLCIVMSFDLTSHT